MARRRYGAEEIVMKLYQVELLLANGHSLADALRVVGATNALYATWLSEYGGLTRTLGPTLGSPAKR